MLSLYSPLQRETQITGDEVLLSKAQCGLAAASAHGGGGNSLFNLQGPLVALRYFNSLQRFEAQFRSTILGHSGT